MDIDNEMNSSEIILPFKEKKRLKIACAREMSLFIDLVVNFQSTTKEWFSTTKEQI